MFYETCQDAVETWDDDWVCCPACGVFAIIDENTGDRVYDHNLDIYRNMH